MSETWHLVVHVLAGHHDGSAVLVAADGALPSTRTTAGGGERLTNAARGAARRVAGLDGPLLQLYGADDAPGDDGAVALLAVLDAPAPEWTPPGGARWAPLGTLPRNVPPALRPRVSELLEEWGDQRPVAALRASWARPGWYDRACAWITQRLTEAGRPPTGPIEQFTHWELSAVMRVETGGGRAWFKAVFPWFGHEPAVTALLSREQPGSVAPVIALDQTEGWLLLDDVGSEVVADHEEADAAAIQRLVQCQRRFVGRHDELRAVGCRERPFRALAAHLATVLADPVTREWIELSDRRVAELTTWVDAAAREVEGLGFPDTLVHGDFHPENVALAPGGPMIFDWSDAAIAHPLVDAMTWSTWLDSAPERGDRAWRCMTDAWSDECPAAAVEAHRRLLAGLAAGYHTVSYGEIVARLEPPCRADLASGLRQYFAVLDAAVPRSDDDPAAPAHSTTRRAT